MRLTKKALSKIKSPQSRMRIALALGVSDRTIERYIKDNDDELTKAAALNIIKEITGLSENQILENQPA
jgi:transcriptional antiterminator